MITTEFEQRLRKLALREGMTIATFAGLGEVDRAVLHATILARFEAATVYTERQVNERLKAWLAGAGSMVETDHVNLRRLLIDTQVLARTADCAEYRVHPEAIAGMPAAPTAQDADAIVAGARRDRQAQRAARKDAWLRQADGAGRTGAP
ncbi:MAG: DUF2087 domain-containing protein [Betaproteobacteria bacterium]|nr:DUF2087 domain-containing protein [Betaproteobacteria bacterium]